MARNANIRIMVLPKIIRKANKITHIINWDEEPVTFPPLLEEYTDEEIKELISNPDVIDLPYYPCHSQATERAIQTVSPIIDQ